MTVPFWCFERTDVFGEMNTVYWKLERVAHFINSIFRGDAFFDKFTIITDMRSSLRSSQVADIILIKATQQTD